MVKSKKNRVNVVYSTNPHFDFEESSDEEISIPFNEQKLYVSIDRKNRGGKSVTLIEEFILNFFFAAIFSTTALISLIEDGSSKKAS